MFDYKLIEAMAIVIREGGFEKGADALFITQSAVSQRIRQLEERTGQVLLTRTTPPVPTSAGRELLKHYQQVKLLEDGLYAAAMTDRSTEATLLAIGINADSLASWFLTAIGPLLEHGELFIDLHVDDQEQTLKLLKEGVVAGAISDNAKVIQGCRVIKLGTMTYRLLALPEFVERWFPDGLNNNSCQLAPAVIFNRKDNLHHQFLRQSLGKKPPKLKAHYVPAPEQFLSMIENGYAHGMIPDWQGESILKSNRLVEVDPNTQISVPLYWHCWNLDSKPLKQLTDHLVTAAKKHLTD